MDCVKAEKVIKQKHIELLIAKLEFELIYAGLKENFAFSPNWYNPDKIVVWIIHTGNKIELGEISVDFSTDQIIWNITKYKPPIKSSPRHFIKWLENSILLFSNFNPTEKQPTNFWKNICWIWESMV